LPFIGVYLFKFVKDYRAWLVNSFNKLAEVGEVFFDQYYRQPLFNGFLADIPYRQALSHPFGACKQDSQISVNFIKGA